MLLPPSTGTGETSRLRGGKHRSRENSSSHGKAHQIYYLKRTWEQTCVFFNWERTSQALRFINQLFSGRLGLCCSLWSVSDILSSWTHCRSFLTSFLPPTCPPSCWLICSSISTVCSHLVYLQRTDAVSSPPPSILSVVSVFPDLASLLCLHMLIIPTQDDTFYRHTSLSPLFKHTPMVWVEWVKGVYMKKKKAGYFFNCEFWVLSIDKRLKNVECLNHFIRIIMPLLVSQALSGVCVQNWMPYWK